MLSNEEMDQSCLHCRLLAKSKRLMFFSAVFSCPVEIRNLSKNVVVQAPTKSAVFGLTFFFKWTSVEALPFHRPRSDAQGGPWKRIGSFATGEIDMLHDVVAILDDTRCGADVAGVAKKAPDNDLNMYGSSARQLIVPPFAIYSAALGFVCERERWQYVGTREDLTIEVGDDIRCRIHKTGQKVFRRETGMRSWCTRRAHKSK